MKQEIPIGQADYSVLIFIPDPASTDGSGKTGLAAADLTVAYARVETDNDVTISDVTSSLSNLTNLTDAHSDWGLKEVSSTLAPGLYRLDIADAVFAAGAWSAVVYVMITTSAAAASPMEFVLVKRDSVVSGVAATDSTATSIITSSLDPAASATDQFKGRIVIFDRDTTTAALRGQATDITASTSGGALTVTALSTAPANGDTFRIY